MGKKTLEFKSYEVTKIDANTWHIADQINSYIYLLEGEQKALLIDTGSGVLPLRPLIEKLTNKPIVVVNTHGHPDHVGANYEFDEVWISEKDAENAALEKTPYKKWANSILDYASHVFNISPSDIVLPTDEERGKSGNTVLRLLSPNMTFDLGNRIIEIIETPGHTHGCICLLDCQKQQLYVGDTYCDSYGILMGLVLKDGSRVADSSLNVTLLKKVTEKIWARREEYSILFPAHHNWPLVPSIIEDYLLCTQEIIASLVESTDGSMINHRYGRAIINYHTIS